MDVKPNEEVEKVFFQKGYPIFTLKDGRKMVPCLKNGFLLWLEEGGEEYQSLKNWIKNKKWFQFWK